MSRLDPLGAMYDVYNVKPQRNIQEAFFRTPILSEPSAQSYVRRQNNIQATMMLFINLIL